MKQKLLAVHIANTTPARRTEQSLQGVAVCLVLVALLALLVGTK